MADRIYPVFEATPGWVAGRLAALSECLLLPCPVRDGFLFRADAAFYRQCTGSIVTLQSAARRIIEHLGLSCRGVVVSFVPRPPFAGRIEHDGGNYFIEIAEQHRNDAKALGAILAHECCHILVGERKVNLLGTAEDEVHVDLAAMLTGLGALTLNGIEDKRQRQGDFIVESHRAFGYLRAPLLRYAHSVVVAALGLGAIRGVRDLDGVTDFAIFGHLAVRHLRAAGRWLFRREPARLCFGTVPEHLVVPCGNEACTQRLRVPVGKPGIVRCPTCSRERRFDARPCAVAPRLLPRAIRPTPAFSRFDRALIGLHRQPLEVKVVAAGAVLLAAGYAVSRLL
ncbi:MAG: hypothetical protein ACYC8T_20165 [Myxococcaceae bacterium]